MKTNDGAWAALTPDAAPGVSFVTHAPLEASAHPRCLSDAGFSAAVVLCVEINQCVGCTENSSLSHFSAMARPSWLD